MKKLLFLLLSLIFLLAACGEKSADDAARQAPPTLTVTSANACSVTLKSGSYNWTCTQGLQSMTAIACGAHPLDENSRGITPVLEIPFTVLAACFCTVTLDFGDNSPDSVSVRCWPSDAWGDTGVPPETVTAQRQDNGTFRAELPQSGGIFAVDALWDRAGQKNDATYTFCTQAEGTKELVYSQTSTFSVEAPVKKLDISCLSGSVCINADCEKLSVETASGYVNISGGYWREADISTVSGAVDFTGTAKGLSLSTMSGTVTADADFYKLDFSAVSGSLTLTMQRAAEVDAETTSGGVTIHLAPSSCGFAPDFDSVSGNQEIAFNANGGDGHWTCGDKASTLNADTVSGNLNLD